MADEKAKKPVETNQSADVLTGVGEKFKKFKLKANKKTVIMVVGGLAAGLLIFLGVFGVLIYKYKSEADAVSTVAKVVPYPVMVVNGRLVGYGEYLFEVSSIKKYYNEQKGQDGKPAIDFNTNEGKAKLVELKKQIMDQLKTDAVTKQLIAKHKIKVSDKELQEQLEQITKATGGGKEKVVEILSKYYGWTYSDLEKKVYFQLAKQKLQTAIATDDNVNSQAKSKAAEVLAKVKAGEDFAELAKKHSQDSSAANGGDLGFFGKGQMVPEFEQAAFALPVGQTSEVVKTKFGYHIIKVLEKKDDTVKASHILIKSIDFDQYLKEQVSKAKTSQYFKI